MINGIRAGRVKGESGAWAREKGTAVLITAKDTRSLPDALTLAPGPSAPATEDRFNSPQ